MCLFLTTYCNFKQGGQDIHNIQDIPFIPKEAHVSFSLQLFVILSKVDKISTMSRISRPSQYLPMCLFLTNYFNLKQGGQDIHNIQDIQSIPIVAHVCLPCNLLHSEQEGQVIHVIQDIQAITLCIPWPPFNLSRCWGGPQYPRYPSYPLANFKSLYPDHSIAIRAISPSWYPCVLTIVL